MESPTSLFSPFPPVQTIPWPDLVIDQAAVFPPVPKEVGHFLWAGDLREEGHQERVPARLALGESG